jgi:hypothetical protein
MPLRAPSPCSPAAPRTSSDRTSPRSQSSSQARRMGIRGIPAGGACRALPRRTVDGHDCDNRGGDRDEQRIFVEEVHLNLLVWLRGSARCLALGPHITQEPCGGPLTIPQGGAEKVSAIDVQFSRPQGRACRSGYGRGVGLVLRDLQRITTNERRQSDFMAAVPRR